MAKSPAHPSAFERLTNLRQRQLGDVLRSETTGGFIMLAATVVALLWANLHHRSYEAIRELPIPFTGGAFDLHALAVDGLLTIFFFVAGLELKKEFTEGALSRPAEALVPIIAAVCGMAVPAGIFLAVNLASPDGHPGGWAIPMATDIAFALAVLAVVGSSLPTPVRAFLLTLAIVDDLGGIIVIAVVFTTGLSFVWLGVALACVLVWWLAQRQRIDHWALYVPLFILCWYATYQSGVHATIAGVALGLASRNTATEGNDPVDRWNHFWSPVSAGFVVPFFAFMAAGVAITPDLMLGVVTSPIGLGIALGLVLGKTIGVFGGAMLTARLTGADLGSEVTWRELLGVGVLAGLGFTVSLLIVELSLPAELIDQAKAAVLTGSLIAAVAGGLLLARRDKVHRAE